MTPSMQVILHPHGAILTLAMVDTTVVDSAAHEVAANGRTADVALAAKRPASSPSISATST